MLPSILHLRPSLGPARVVVGLYRHRLHGRYRLQQRLETLRGGAPCQIALWIVWGVRFGWSWVSVVCVPWPWPWARAWARAAPLQVLRLANTQQLHLRTHHEHGLVHLNPPAATHHARRSNQTRAVRAASPLRAIVAAAVAAPGPCACVLCVTRGQPPVGQERALHPLRGGVQSRSSRRPTPSASPHMHGGGMGVVCGLVGRGARWPQGMSVRTGRLNAAEEHLPCGAERGGRKHNPTNANAASTLDRWWRQGWALRPTYARARARRSVAPGRWPGPSEIATELGPGRAPHLMH